MKLFFNLFAHAKNLLRRAAPIVYEHIEHWSNQANDIQAELPAMNELRKE